MNLTLLKTLKTKNTSQPGGRLFVSAASGLALYNNRFYVVCDDEQSLATFPMEGLGDGEFIPLFPGLLPLDTKDRKKEKADLEAILILDGLLLALPSGSTLNRQRGISYTLPHSIPKIIDVSSLYNELSKTFPELNIEGACVHQKELVLLQRGNGVQRQNGLITLDLAQVLLDLNDQMISIKSLKTIHHCSLPSLKGIDLTFTDGASFNGKLYFLAVAEDSQSTYEDGLVAGSILGILSETGTVKDMIPLSMSSKPEGLLIHGNHFYVVTDDDKADEPAHLYMGELPF